MRNIKIFLQLVFVVGTDQMTNPGRHLSCPAEGRDRDVLNVEENQNFYFFFQFSLLGFYTTEANEENSKDN